MRPTFASTNRRFCCPPSSPGSTLHLFCSRSPPATSSPCPILRSTWRDPAPLMRPVRADTHLPVLDSSLSQCTYEISWKRVNIKSPWDQSKSTFSSNPASPTTPNVLTVAVADISPIPQFTPHYPHRPNPAENPMKPGQIDVPPLVGSCPTPQLSRRQPFHAVCSPSWFPCPVACPSSEPTTRSRRWPHGCTILAESCQPSTMSAATRLPKGTHP